MGNVNVKLTMSIRYQQILVETNVNWTNKQLLQKLKSGELQGYKDEGNNRDWDGEKGVQLLVL